MYSVIEFLEKRISVMIICILFFQNPTTLVVLGNVKFIKQNIFLMTWKNRCEPENMLDWNS